MARSRSRSRSPVRRKHYDDPRDRRRDRRSPAPSGLLVRNISLSARPEDLRVPFERFGPVKDVYLPKNYYTGEPRGFGFVKFRYPEDAAEAKSHLNHSVIGGREIRIVFAEENRKTPHEMRRITHRSSRVSHRRRSPSFSPKHRHHSYSRSPSPARHVSSLLEAFSLTVEHIMLWGTTMDHMLAFTVLVQNCPLSSFRDRGRKARDDYYSPRRSRSVSRSLSPRVGRSGKSNERSRRHSRSVSRSVSPHEERNHRPNLQSPSPRENGHTSRSPSRSPSPRRSSKSPARSRSRT